MLARYVGMKPEQLVASRELCQSLVDKGIVLDTYFWWGHPVDDFGKRLRKWILGYNDPNNGDGFCDSCNHGWIPAPTAEELWDWLNDNVEEGLFVRKQKAKWYGCRYNDNVGTFSVLVKSDSAANALAELAI